MKRVLTILMVLSLPLALFAQMSVSGTVTDAETGNALAGANVVVEGTTLGAAADADGAFSISNVPADASITASMIGYDSMTLAAAANLNFKLEQGAIKLSALEVLASRADAKTPVAFTNVSKADMEVRLGSQDIPMALNTTPSVYATQQGGGAGDARINVRGFNQRNVAVMINGVPQNDMENGWVYWSNWDGVGDATSSIQMQRGLSAVNLATPSIGGTMNIITDPTALTKGGKFKGEIGAGGFLKSTFNYNTGLIADKYAFSTTIVRKVGDGLIDKTWTDAWAYYFGASYQMDAKNRFELYAIGAPQRHGQNLYKQNIAAYDSAYAKTVEGFDVDAISAFVQHEDGRLYNENASAVSSSYEGKQYWYMYGEGGLFGGGLQDRHDPDFLNERENFFHKPLVNLNHYLTINDKMRLSSILYWSGGSGGGTGTYGSVKWNYHAGISSPSRWVHYDKTIENNSNVDSTFSYTEARSYGILRNSINRQNTIGLISKLNYDFSEELKFQVGLDWRTAGIEHTREVRDLLGGDYFVDLDYDDDDNPFMVDPNAEFGTKSYLGDNIDYHNETTVDWIGFFGQGSYSSGPISAYGMAGLSSIAYSYRDHFTVEDKKIVADPISTIQVKGGAMYDVMGGLSLFANFGLVEKPPIMDNVIYYDGTVASDPINEKFQSMEAGVNYTAGNIAVKANYYNTDWKDRNLTKAVTTGQGSSGDTDVIFLTGVNQNHSGVEVEASAQLIDMLRIDAALSFGDWSFVDDASGTYQDEAGVIIGEYDYALKDLMVGDMPQTSYVAGVTLTPFSGLKLQVLYNMYDNNYSDWSPDSREIGDDGEADREQVWMAPGYSKMDVHLFYDLPKMAGMKVQAFAHLFNALDDVYVQDAVDNSKYNSYGDNVHAAHNAEVFLGTPRYFNAGISVKF
ncbi:MAG: carboxypeptidase-like regulatory domain-containing protein [Candidatus Marinimicrobia bacterium]|nr:carboxypeptidase-like regulatory domain-containing protein [Candidatus Neomarinimicrobiota bacterium]